MGITPLAWKKHCQFCTDSPTLCCYILVLSMPNVWNWSLTHLVVHPHESLTHPYNQLRWQWKPNATSAALLVTLLSQVHPNTQKLCLNQGLNSDAAALYRWVCCLSSSYPLFWAQLEVRSATTLSRATTALPASNNPDTVTKLLLLLICPTEENLKQALLTTTVGVWYLPTHFYRSSGCQVSLLSENAMC